MTAFEDREEETSGDDGVGSDVATPSSRSSPTYQKSPPAEESSMTSSRQLAFRQDDVSKRSTSRMVPLRAAAAGPETNSKIPTATFALQGNVRETNASFAHRGEILLVVERITSSKKMKRPFSRKCR